MTVSDGSTRHHRSNVRLQTPCTAGSRHRPSHQLLRWHRSSHRQCCLHTISNTIKGTQACEDRTQNDETAARHSHRHRVSLTLHICQIKPRDVAAIDQRPVDSHDRGLHIPLIFAQTTNQSSNHAAMSELPLCNRKQCAANAIDAQLSITCF